ncbi:unnamed protein product [Closterium sp. Naga37s-1]|nr:unnamed protein product [Closterium sp. Naga37s-1]
MKLRILRLTEPLPAPLISSRLPPHIVSLVRLPSFSTSPSLLPPLSLLLSSSPLPSLLPFSLPHSQERRLITRTLEAPQNERTYAIRKAHVNVDKALKAAEVVLEKYDVARQVEERIKEGPKNALDPYLAAIARLHEGVAYFEANRSFKSAEAALAHSKALLREGHHRLEDALRQQLLQYTKDADPAKLLDASKQGEEEGGGEGEKEDGGLPVLLADGKAGDRIRQLAEALIRIGRADNCLKIYTEVRGTMVEAGLKRIAVEKLTREQMDGMSWGELEKRIEGWRRQTRLAVHVVFMAERELCETVLAGLEPHTGKAFADLAGLTLGMLFGFGEAVARSKKSPEKVSVLMDMYETMRDLMPQVEVVFAGSACDAIRGSAQQLLQHLAAAAKEAFNNFELAVESEDSDKVLPDGATHGLTSYVVNYLKYLYDYQATMQELFGRENLFGEATIRIFAALHANLERKSKLYRDPALTQLFLMNNVHYIVHAVRKGELKEVVGKDWIDRQRRIVQQHAAAYQRTSWNKIFGLLTSAGLNADGKEGSVSRSALKERFRLFNATFEELHRSQCMWKVPDPELRSAVQLQIAEVLLPAYRAFVQRYTPSPASQPGARGWGLCFISRLSLVSPSPHPFPSSFPTICPVLENGDSVASHACPLSLISSHPPPISPMLESGGRFGRSSEAASKYICFTEEGLDSLLPYPTPFPHPFPPPLSPTPFPHPSPPPLSPTPPSLSPVLESGGRFGRSSEAASKYIRFTEEGLDSLLNEFFQGRESRNILLTQPAAR